MLELILMRHGETESNTRMAYVGRTDVPLNPRGEKQVTRAAQHFMQENLDAIYVSPLKRTMQTARAILKYQDKPLIKKPELCERDFGIWDDLSYEEIQAQYPAEHDAWLADWANYQIPRGESAAEVYERNCRAVDEIVAEHPDGRVLVVTHLGCIRNMLAYLLGMGLPGTFRFTVRTAGICRVEIDEGQFAVLKSLNET